MAFVGIGMGFYGHLAQIVLRRNFSRGPFDAGLSVGPKLGTRIDFPEREKRFDVVYHLLSMQQNHRIRLKLQTDEDTPVPSIVGIFPCADWFEREAFDMYGILFSNHPDLRRILTDYGFEGYPLRKDFPLSGHVEVWYDTEQQRVAYQPVKLPQAFRNFDFLSPWEGMTLPGDEKAEQAEEKKP